MAEHDLNKIVDDEGEVFNLRDTTKQPTADRVTTSTGWGSTPSDTKYPSEKLVKDSLDAKAPNAPSEVTIANGDKIVITDASDSNKVKRASVAFDGSTETSVLTKKGTFKSVSDIISGDYRTKNQDISKGANLVVNGSGRMASNYNFSSCSYIPTIANGGSAGSFGFSGSVVEDEYISCDFNKKIVISADIKNLVAQPSNCTHRIAVYEYDIDKKGINAPSRAFGAGTLTQLTQDLNPGDTVVHLADLSNANWLSSTKHHRGFIFWNYKNSYDYLYPPETYSRNYYPSSDSSVLWDVANVNVSAGTITLNNAWAGPLIPAGTKVSRRSSGGLPYPASSNFFDTEWHSLKGSMKGIVSGLSSTQFSPATAFIKVGLVPTGLSNTDEVTNKRAVVANFLVYEEQELSDAFGTLPIANGGTGATTAKAAEYNLTTGKSEISDTTSGDDRVVFELASPSESNGVTRGFRKLSTIWTWIKGLLSSETGVNISGNAATASAAQSGSALETAINGKMNTSASNATAPSGSGGDGATATLLNNLTDGKSDIVTTDDGDNVLIATTDNGGSVTNKWYKRKLVKLIPWIIKKLGTRLVYDCGAGSTSGDDFDAALAAFNAGQWVIIRKDGIVYYCVGSYSGPGLRFKQIANDASLLKVNTISWTRGSSPSAVTQMEASLSGHTHSQYLTASSITGKMNTDAGNAASGALQNLTGQLTEGTSDFTDNTEIFTSYAGNSGFAESGHVNQPYRRKALSMLNYVRDWFAIDRSPANVGTTHKRISLGYGKYSSSNYVGAMTYIVRLFFNYADDGGLQGKGITVLVTYDFRRSGTQKSECRILSDNGVRDAGYNVVLANYVSGSGDNGKLYICIGLVKNSAPTTLVEFNYSYCKIFRVGTVGDWVQSISSDAVGTYDYLIQATDLVSAAVNADMVDGKHIVIGSWAGASNTIYFG